VPHLDAFITPGSPVHGSLSLPPDKAICHRAALLASVGEGHVTITPWSSAEDCRRTVELVRALGVGVEPTPRGLQINGVGLTGLRASREPLSCGESGTTMRLAAGLLAGQPFASELVAEASLARRPMRRIVEPLTRMGARCEGTTHPNSTELFPPLRLHGHRPLRGLRHELPVASAQVKSAILLAGVYADGPTTIIEPSATRDHTERLFARLGVSIQRVGTHIILTPPTRSWSLPSVLTVPCDPSSAAFFLAAAALCPGSRLTIPSMGLNPTRIHFLTVLQRMGAAIEWVVDDDAWEPRGTVTVAHQPLHGTTVSAHEVSWLIDELPILMVVACAAEGHTSFEGMGELRVKETDRFQSMTTGLQRLGATLAIRQPASVVMTRSRLRGAAIESFGDHRTAMSLAVAALCAEGPTTIRGAECVAKSLGTFFELLQSVTSPATVRLIDAVPLAE